MGVFSGTGHGQAAMNGNSISLHDSPAVSLSTASAADATAIARVHVATWRATHRGLVEHTFLDGLDVGVRAEQWSNWLELPERRTVVAKHDGALIGFCAGGPARDPDATSSTAEIYALYVEQAHWRRGHGGALLDRALFEIEDEGTFSQVTLWVLERNFAARSFYEKFGFIVDGVSKIQRIGGTALNELRYRRRLG